MLKFTTKYRPSGPEGSSSSKRVISPLHGKPPAPPPGQSKPSAPPVNGSRKATSNDNSIRLHPESERVTSTVAHKKLPAPLPTGTVQSQDVPPLPSREVRSRSRLIADDPPALPPRAPIRRKHERVRRINKAFRSANSSPERSQHEFYQSPTRNRLGSLHHLGGSSELLQTNRYADELRRASRVIQFRRSSGPILDVDSPPPVPARASERSMSTSCLLVESSAAELRPQKIGFRTSSGSSLSLKTRPVSDGENHQTPSQMSRPTSFTDDYRRHSLESLLSQQQEAKGPNLLQALQLLRLDTKKKYSSEGEVDRLEIKQQTRPAFDTRLCCMFNDLESKNCCFVRKPSQDEQRCHELLENLIEVDKDRKPTLEQFRRWEGSIKMINPFFQCELLYATNQEEEDGKPLEDDKSTEMDIEDALKKHLEDWKSALHLDIRKVEACLEEHEEKGKEVEKQSEECLGDKDSRKLHQFFADWVRVIKLTISLSSRLSKLSEAENKEKCHLLKTQLGEARDLKDNITTRFWSLVVPHRSKFSSKELSALYELVANNCALRIELQHKRELLDYVNRLFEAL